MGTIIQFPASVSATPPAPPPAMSVEYFHMLRSRIIDKCAEIECQVGTLIKRSEHIGKLPKATPLGQKVALLRDHGPPPGLPPRRERALFAVLDGIASILELRGTLSHSTLSLGQMDGQPVFLLSEPMDQFGKLDRRVVLTREQLELALKRVNDLANRLNQLAA